MAHGTQQAIGSVDWQGTCLKAVRYQLGTQLEESVSVRKDQVSFRNDTWRRLRAHGTDGTTDRIQKQNDRNVSNQGKTHQSRVNGKHQSIDQNVARESEELCISTIPDLSTCS